MLNTVFTDGSVTAAAFTEVLIFALVTGIYIAFMYMHTAEKYSRSFVSTLALLPVIVEVIILMVNGSIGAGVAVAGAFSLIRFRSAQGSAREILYIFTAMATGLAAGMGYIMIAAILAVTVTIVSLIIYRTGFGAAPEAERILKITIPENLDFEGVFDDIFAAYTKSAQLDDVRTTGMGSLYRLTYHIQMRESASLHKMIDEMRTRNGNLEVSCSRPQCDTEGVL